MKMPSRYFIGVFAIIVVVLTNSLSAQEVLEEIKVTAQKREQSIQDVGISITAFSGDNLRELGFTTSTDVVSQAPNVEILQPFGPGNNANFVVRGIGLNDFNDGTEAPITSYVDEFYILPLAAVGFQLFDIERVEILRGPQGTIFGRNSTGGAIQFITRKPGEEFNGYVDTTVGNYGRVNVEAAVGAKFSDAVSGRFAVVSRNADGWLKNIKPDGADLFEEDSLAFRGSLNFDLTENLSLFLKASHGESKGLTSGYQQIAAFDDPTTGLVIEDPSGTTYFGYNENDAGAGAFDVANADGNDLDVESDHYLARIDWDLGWGTMTSLTGYMELNKALYEDCDAGPFDNCHARYIYDTDIFSQELRFAGDTDRFGWLAGVYYLSWDSQSQQDAGLDFEYVLDTALGGGVFGPFVLESDWEQKLDSYSLFAQGEYDLTDRLTLVAGFRYTRDEKEFEQLKKDFIPALDPITFLPLPGGSRNGDYDIWDVLPFAVGGSNFTRNQTLQLDTDFDGVVDTILPPVGNLTKNKDNLWSGKLQLNWRLSDRALAYLSWSRGIKAGGFNNGFISNVGPEIIPYSDETVDAYEIGLKTDIGAGTRLSGAVFYYDYSDFQAFSFIDLGGVITNRDATLWGAELELYSAPLDGLEIIFGASYNDSKVKDINTGLVTLDRKMAMAPNFSANGIVRYSWPVSGGTLSVQGDFTHVGDRFPDVQNHPGTKLSSYTVGNARIGYLSESERWEVAAWMKNISDVEYSVMKFPLTVVGIVQHTYGQPRTAGVTVRFMW